jgi:hypothetical protein
MTTLNYARPRPNPYPRFFFVAVASLAISFTLPALMIFGWEFFGLDPDCILCLSFATLAIGELATIMAIDSVSEDRPAIAFTLPFCLIALPLFSLATCIVMPHRCPPRPAFFHLTSGIRSLSSSSQTYAATHDGRFPPHPPPNIHTGTHDPKDLARPTLAPFVPPAPLPPENTWPAIASVLDAHSLYIYTGADLNASNLPSASNIILAYSKPHPYTPSGRVILFADGHSDLIADKDLSKIFAASNSARAKLNLPPFTEGSPPPIP